MPFHHRMCRTPSAATIGIATDEFPAICYAGERLRFNSPREKGKPASNIADTTWQTGQDLGRGTMVSIIHAVPWQQESSAPAGPATSARPLPLPALTGIAGFRMGRPSADRPLPTPNPGRLPVRDSAHRSFQVSAISLHSWPPATAPSIPLSLFNRRWQPRRCFPIQHRPPESTHLALGQTPPFRMRKPPRGHHQTGFNLRPRPAPHLHRFPGMELVSNCRTSAPSRYRAHRSIEPKRPPPTDTYQTVLVTVHHSWTMTISPDSLTKLPLRRIFRSQNSSRLHLGSVELSGS